MWKKIVVIVGTIVLMVAFGLIAYVTAVILFMGLGTKFHGNYEYYGRYNLIYLFLFGSAAVGFLAPGGVVWYLVNQAGFAPSQEFPSYLALGASPSLCPSGYDGSPHLRRGSLVF